jgi:predicted phosphodiesterase
MLHYRYGFIQTVVKIVKRADIDVVSMVGKWAIHSVISSLCGVSKRLFLVEGNVCVLKFS